MSTVVLKPYASLRKYTDGKGAVETEIQPGDTIEQVLQRAGFPIEMVRIVVVNGVNASQAAICAAAGVLLFGEALTWAMSIGSGLTVVGLLLMAPPRADSRDAVG